MTPLRRRVLVALVTLFSAFFSALAIGLASGLCPIPANGGVAFAEGMVMLFVFAIVILLAGLLLIAERLRNSAERRNRRISVWFVALLICCPILSLSLSVAHQYQTCPGYGHALTPEQREILEHG